MIFEILPARLHDLNALKTLENEVFRQDAWPVLDILAALIFPGGIHLKAQFDGTIIGFISVEENLFDSIAWVSLVGVAAPYRGQGVGRSLMTAAEKRTRRTILQLCVRRSNLGAIHLYEKLGYQKKEIRQHYYADGEDAYLMRKELRSKPDFLL
ncbi:MAG: GNAT family N-acetyltransferase [Leptolinea sp.]|nr:GNAT family N-acetyltransferase [Leptolinea sp.]